MKKDKSTKLTFREKMLEKTFQPICNKLITACYMVYYKELKSSSMSYDDFMIAVRDILSGNVE